MDRAGIVPGCPTGAIAIGRRRTEPAGCSVPKPAGGGVADEFRTTREWQFFSDLAPLRHHPFGRTNEPAGHGGGATEATGETANPGCDGNIQHNPEPQRTPSKSTSEVPTIF